MLLWLDRSPESFLPNVSDADDSRFRLPRLTRGHILRWDSKALHAALDTERKARGMTGDAGLQSDSSKHERCR